MGKQDKRIRSILGKNSDRISENILKYYEYLESRIQHPCRLTGIEDFPWEEPYVIGGRSKKEYEKLKKNNPSHTDEYELIEFIKPAPENDEVFVKVKRISDNKIFEIGLSWLKCIDSESENYQLIDDYSLWYVNY